MSTSTIFMLLMLLTLVAFIAIRQRSLKIAGFRSRDLHSLPRHYGYFAAACVVLPGLSIITLWLVFGTQVIDGLVIQGLTQSMEIGDRLQAQLVINRVKLVADTSTVLETNPHIIAAAQRYQALIMQGRYVTVGLTMIVGLIGLYYAYNRTGVTFRARNKFENIIIVLLASSSAIAVLTTLGIVLSLLFESLRFFQEVPVNDFLFGTHWSPQAALTEDHSAARGTYGAVPLFAGTLMISLIAMCVAVPIGLMSAIYMTQYASKPVRKLAKPLLEILAGVPTVVYGFFAVLVIAPAFRQLGEAIGIPVDSHSALAAGTVMGIMIIPYISSLSDDAITAVPQTLKEGSLALGATQSETITRVLLPAALPGIMGGILLAVSRAIGETMIVVMAAGMQANLTANPTEAVTTVTVQIVKLLTGDQEFDSAKTLSAFALGLMLFIATLALNLLAQRTVRRYREAYD